MLYRQESKQVKCILFTERSIYIVTVNQKGHTFI